MPVDRMFWSGSWNRDLHLLVGQTSADLSAVALAFQDGSANAFAAAYRTAHPGAVTLSFQPLFKGVLAGSTFEAFGIHVDTNSGQIRVDAARPAPPRKDNFIIEITAVDTTVGRTFTETVRVHIHTSVTHIWLSPDPVTVRPTATPPETTGYRFTARVEFDDGTSGDVTENHGLTWAPPANFTADGHFVRTAADAVGSDVTVIATYPDPSGHKAGARVHIAEPWASDATRPKLSVVPGGGWPGTIAPEKVPNILFLGDGFAAADQATFERMTNSFVQYTKLDPLVRPFDLLATSMNFWRTFVPAAGNGISVRSEVALHPDDATKALPVPDAEKAIGAEAWTVSNLIYAVGLPMPADAGKAPAALRAEWQATVSPNPTPHVGDDSLIVQWQKLSTRAFIEELDRFPSLSYGTPPAANGRDRYGLDLHKDRGGVVALRAFYRPLASESGVTLGDGTEVGRVWSDKTPAFRFDNTDLVVLLSSFPGGRAVNGAGYIALSTKTENAALPITPVAGHKGFILGALALLADASPDSCRTLAHELGHSFGLGDEYADFRQTYPNQADLLADCANLQTETSAKGGGAAFVGDQIKWNWLRIRTAAVIDGTITEAAGTFTIPVHGGQGFAFAAGDQVLLRVRVPGTPLGKTPDMLKSGEALQITGAPTATAITATPVVPGSVTLAQLSRFTAGSIVLVPTPAPASVKSAAYPYAEMVALNVKNAITSQNRPLTPVPCSNTIGPSEVAPDLSGISLPGLLCFKNKPRIVGLYENGARYTCGIYHPTGTCMMRQDHEEHAEFCAVCRYILVEFINPFRHFQIDQDYAEVYPLE